MGVKANIVINGTAIFSGKSPFILQNSAIINTGTLTFSATGAIEASQNTIITNSANAVFVVTGQLSVTQSDQTAGFMSEIRNHGTFQFSNSAPSALALRFRNLVSGTVIVNGPVAIISGFYSQERDSNLTLVQVSGVITLHNAAEFVDGGLEGNSIHL